MQNEHWGKVKSILAEAMALDPAARDVFLDRVCSGDPDIKTEVAELLLSFEDSSDFLETPLVAKQTLRLNAGDIKGRYEIIEQIGKGGMGEVYRALDLSLKRSVALKVLPSEFTNDPSRVERFKSEARAASSLNHPNIITIYEIGEIDGLTFIASEFVEGKTMRAIIDEDERDLDSLIGVVRQLLTGLAAADKAGIVHRDIKPENVMVREDGLVKILDFGLAKRFATDIKPHISAVNQTEKGLIVGTLAYMSPEQARGHATDLRTDLWSFGVLLYELLARQKPFTGDTSSDVLASILTAGAPVLPGGVPRSLARIVDRAMQKSVDKRYQNCGDIINDLDAVHPSDKTRWSGWALRPGYGKSAVFAAAVVIAFGIFLGYRNYRQASPTNTSHAAAKTSLAVLPFTNADPETQYLSDGMTEAIIDNLSGIADLRVASRDAAYGFKDRPDPPAEVARGLRVESLLTGELIPSGDGWNLDVKLVDVSGERLWQDSFRMTISDVQKVEGEISKHVSESLKLKFDPQHFAIAAQRYTGDPEAYREYLRGRYYMLQYTSEGHTRALEHLNRAVDLDPTFALGYAGIADAYTTASDWILPPREALSKASAAAQKALDLDDQLAEAWAARGHARLHDADRNAIDDLNRAVELAPQTLTNQLWLGEYYMIWDIPKSIERLNMAADLDPLAPAPLAFASFDYYMQRQYDKSVETALKAVSVVQQYNDEYAYLAMTYLAEGDNKAAFDAVNKPPSEADDAVILSARAAVLAKTGNRKGATAILSRLQKLSSARYVSPYYLALVYKALGDYDKTFEFLNRACDDRSENLIFIRNVPYFDDLRDDPRYEALLRRVGFDQ